MFAIFLILAFSLLVVIFQFIKKGTIEDKIIAICSFFLATSVYFASKDSFSQTQNIEKLGKIDTSIGHHLDTLQQVNNSLSQNIKAAVEANKELSGKTYSITNKIKDIDSNIQSLSNEINNFITGANSYPRIDFYNQRSPSLERDIILYNVGKYPMHGLYIDIIDDEIMHGNPAANAYKKFTRHYDVDELSWRKKIDSIELRLDYSKSKMQTFDIQISATNGKFHERACFIPSGYMVNS
ncbi:MAG TPA: hypothetical protein VGG71_10080, partial [Chitinophagaceae bacterium]